MLKLKKFLRSLSLIFTLLLIPNSFLFAQEESITITTYYPSPQGSYNELATNRLAIGDTNNSGGLDAADQPNRDGDIRLKAQTGNPAAWPAGTTGQFSYSSIQDSLYHYNGSAWVASGAAGGGGCYISYSGSIPCLTGFTNKGSAGSWGTCGGNGVPIHFRPAGGGCYGGWQYGALGDAYVCCQ